MNQSLIFFMLFYLGGVKEPCDPALLVSWSGSIKSLTCTRKKEHASHKHFVSNAQSNLTALN